MYFFKELFIRLIVFCFYLLNKELIKENSKRGYKWLYELYRNELYREIGFFLFLIFIDLYRRK